MQQLHLIVLLLLFIEVSSCMGSRRHAARHSIILAGEGRIVAHRCTVIASLRVTYMAEVVRRC